MISCKVSVDFHVPDVSLVPIPWLVVYYYYLLSDKHLRLVPTRDCILLRFSCIVYTLAYQHKDHVVKKIASLFCHSFMKCRGGKIMATFNNKFWYWQEKNLLNQIEFDWFCHKRLLDQSWKCRLYTYGKLVYRRKPLSNNNSANKVSHYS